METHGRVKLLWLKQHNKKDLCLLHHANRKGICICCIMYGSLNAHTKVAISAGLTAFISTLDGWPACSGHSGALHMGEQARCWQVALLLWVSSCQSTTILPHFFTLCLSQGLLWQYRQAWYYLSSPTHNFDLIQHWFAPVVFTDRVRYSAAVNHRLSE